MKTRIGVLGPEGTYSEKAALIWSEGMPSTVLVYFKDFDGVLQAVEEGELDYGIVPLENDLYLALCLVGQGESEIKIILSHPQALAQCRQFIREHYPGAEIRTTGSTSHAARLAQEFGEMAAIADSGAAERYGLRVLARDVQDVRENVTRFIVAGRQIPGATGKDKTSLIIHLAKDRPGALYSILQEFAQRSINLTRIESRPSRRGLGDYYFYIDLEGHQDNSVVLDALEKIREKAGMVKVLGSYPRDS